MAWRTLSAPVETPDEHGVSHESRGPTELDSCQIRARWGGKQGPTVVSNGSENPL